MDMEQRVKILEQELEILKGQIQATLLEIQEHILTNTYPALRAEELPQIEKLVSSEASSSSPRGPSAELDDDDEDDMPLSSIVKRVRLIDSESSSDDASESRPRNGKVKLPPQIEDVSEDDEEAEQPPYVRRVAVDESPTQPRKSHQFVQKVGSPEVNEPEYEHQDEPDTPSAGLNGRWNNAEHHMAGAHPNDTNTYHEAQSKEAWWPSNASTNPSLPDPVSPFFDGNADWTALNRLAEWVSNKVAKVGAHRTKELIEKNAQKGNLTPEVKDALLQLVLLYDDNGSLNSQRLDEVLEKLTQPTALNVSESGPAAIRLEDQKLILRLITGIKNIGANSAWRANSHG